MLLSTRRILAVLLTAVVATSVLWPAPDAADSAFAVQKRKRAQKRPQPKLPDLKSPEDKRRFLAIIRGMMPMRRISRNIVYTSDDLDRALDVQIGLPESRYAPFIDDEAFIRRASLDLTGKVPSPQKIRQFAADSSPDKRSRLIDELLETKDYARKWARYWRAVVFHDSAANKNRVNPQSLEDWLAGQFEKNVRWDEIVAEMVSATPKRKKQKLPNGKTDYGQDYGPNNFVLANENKAPEVASATARIFMGISIQCAECHDHPFDQWKREQFHELAAFFSPGNYYMTDQDDPKKKTRKQAKFLLGETPPENLKSDQRRVAVAAYLIYNPSNYWFARAYVNRVWNELIGDGFYSVDSLGPDQEVIHKLVVNRIAAVFRYREFDPKWLFRLIMNSNTYQRDIRTLDSTSEYFTAVRPSRMRPGQVADNVQRLTGADKNLDRALKATFKVDPSIPQRDLEGSIQQALLMMNNGTLQSKLNNGVLKKRLVTIRDNRELVTELYLGTLARKPTASDMNRALDHLRTSGNRNEAIEDLLWVLVNSAEFLTKR